MAKHGFMALLLSWGMLTLSVWAAAELLPGVEVDSVGDAMVVATIFGVLNWCIGLGLFVLLGLGTLGLGFLLAFLSRWLVDAVLLRITAALSPRLRIKSFGWAVLCAMFMSALGTLAQWFVLGGRAHRL